MNFYYLNFLLPFYLIPLKTFVPNNVTIHEYTTNLTTSLLNLNPSNEADVKTNNKTINAITSTASK